MFIMSERHWNRQFMGVDSEIQIKTKSGELIVTVHTGGSGYDMKKTIPNDEHYDYYEGEWDGYFID